MNGFRELNFYTCGFEGVLIYRLGSLLAGVRCSSRWRGEVGEGGSSLSLNSRSTVSFKRDFEASFCLSNAAFLVGAFFYLGVGSRLTPTSIRSNAVLS